jgi:hypothetical protein
MKHCRERALILLEVAERTAQPEIRAKAATLAEAWLTLAAMDDALAIGRTRQSKDALAQTETLPNLHGTNRRSLAGFDLANLRN